MSASALGAVTKEFHNEQPAAMDRKVIRAARDSIVKFATPYGPMMQTLNMAGTTGIEMPFADPFAMLWSLTKQSEGFASLMKNTLQSKPSSLENPWRMVLYSDEVVPGNQLSFHNLRKVWVLYYSFLEFGEEALALEDSWICLAVAKTDTVKTVDGGMAQVFNVILDYIFGSSTGQSLHQTGIFLEFPDHLNMQPTRFFACLSGILQDGGAHKQVFLVKGDAGSKFCVACRTLYAERSEVDAVEGLQCNLLQEDEQDFASDADLRGTVERLAGFAATCSKDELRLREQACGFTHNAHNLLLNPRLQNIVHPVSQFMHDWMHTFMVHGVFNTITMLALSTIAEESAGAIDDLQAYISKFTPPVRNGGNMTELSQCMSKARWNTSKKAGYFKCTASDALTLFPILALYFQTVFLRAGIAPAACRAFLSLTVLLDLLVAVPHRVVTPELLRKASSKFLEDVVKAGWREYCHPKFHWIIHLPQELQRFDTLLSCWVHERKHKMVKRYAQTMHNTCAFERAVLSEVTCHHLVEVGQPEKFNFSVRVLPPFKKAASVLIEILQTELRLPNQSSMFVSKHARVSKFEICHSRDVVLFSADGDETKLHCGQIWFFVKIEEGVHDHACGLAVVEEWPRISALANGASMVVEVTNAYVKTLLLSDIKVACTHRRDDGQAKVLVPIMYRKQI